uniref:Uncharacterized protein n=1 Tax=Steinernema glaseri TaxID=37863 RepID=A0A1I7Y6K6_9BILA
MRQDLKTRMSIFYTRLSTKRSAWTTLERRQCVLTLFEHLLITEDRSRRHDAECELGTSGLDGLRTKMFTSTERSICAADWDYEVSLDPCSPLHHIRTKFRRKTPFAAKQRLRRDHRHSATWVGSQEPSTRGRSFAEDGLSWTEDSADTLRTTCVNTSSWRWSYFNASTPFQRNGFGQMAAFLQAQRSTATVGFAVKVLLSRMDFRTCGNYGSNLLLPPVRSSLYRALKIELPAETGSRVPLPYRIQCASTIHLNPTNEEAVNMELLENPERAEATPNTITGTITKSTNHRVGRFINIKSKPPTSTDSTAEK